MSPVRYSGLFATTIALWAFVIFVSWIASKETLVFIGTYHIDKIFHGIGGLFIALAFEWLSPRKTLVRLLVVLFVIILSWEAIEFFFDPKMQAFYQNAYTLWLLDTSGDITAAALTCYSYWVFWRRHDSCA